MLTAWIHKKNGELLRLPVVGVLQGVGAHGTSVQPAQLKPDPQLPELEAPQEGPELEPPLMPPGTEMSFST